MRIPILQVDAFSSELFAVNPASRMPPDAWLACDQLQSIALKNSLSETAYLVDNEAGYRRVECI